MEPFEINLVGEILTVLPNSDESFNIFKGEEYLGKIIPNIDEQDMLLRWRTLDLMSEDYAQQVEELIEEHDM